MRNKFIREIFFIVSNEGTRTQTDSCEEQNMAQLFHLKLTILV